MTILVTGATGNIGSHVVRQLVRDSRATVRTMTRDTDRAKSLFGSDVEIVYGDFVRPETWYAALRGVERLYLFPAVAVEPDGVASGGDGFIDHAVRAGVRRIVAHSAIAAGFEPLDGSANPALQRHLEVERVAHRAIERAVEAAGVEWTHVRPGLLAVGTLDWAEQIRTTGVVRAPFPESGHPLVHEDDVADVAVAALLTDEHIGQVYSVTGPRRVSQREQVKAIADAVGHRIPFVEITPEQARDEWYAPEQGIDEEVLDWLLALMEASDRDPAMVPVTDTYERLIGRPARDFHQWARDHAADFRPPGPA